MKLGLHIQIKLLQIWKKLVVSSLQNLRKTYKLKLSDKTRIIFIIRFLSDSLTGDNQSI